MLLLALLLLTSSCSAQFNARATDWFLGDVAKDLDIALLSNNTIINLSSLPGIVIGVVTSPYPLGGTASLWFDFNNTFPYRIEQSSPYIINGDDGGDYSSWYPSVGANQVVTATPWSNNVRTNPGNPGTKSTLVLNFVRETYCPSCYVGPNILQGGPAGNHQIQLQKTTNTYDVQVDALEILFSYRANIDNGQYEIGVYTQTSAGVFQLDYKQPFNVAVNRVPKLIPIDPPVPVLAGKYIGIVNAAGALGLPSTNANTALGFYAAGVGSVSNTIGSNVTTTLQSTSPSWRAMVSAYIPTTGQATTSQPTTARATTGMAVSRPQIDPNQFASGSSAQAGSIAPVAAGVVVAVLLVFCLVGIVGFFLWRRKNKKRWDAALVTLEGKRTPSIT